MLPMAGALPGHIRINFYPNQQKELNVVTMEKFKDGRYADIMVGKLAVEMGKRDDPFYLLLKSLSRETRFNLLANIKGVNPEKYYHEVAHAKNPGSYMGNINKAIGDAFKEASKRAVEIK